MEGREELVFLELNDNRKYKMERYKEEILKLAGNERQDRNSSKRLLFSYRNRNGEKLSLHAVGTFSGQVKPKLNTTTIRGRLGKEKAFKSAGVSPDEKIPRKGESNSLHCSMKGLTRFALKQRSQHEPKLMLSKTFYN